MLSEQGFETAGREALRASSIVFDGVLPDWNKLYQHYLLLTEWNRTHNLSSLEGENDVLLRHFIDSLAGIAAIGRPQFSEILDAGSGGGFPGLVAAACWPNVRVTLLEANRKKASFLRYAAGQSGVSNAVVRQARLESLTALPNIMSRAAFSEKRWGMFSRSLSARGRAFLWVASSEDSDLIERLDRIGLLLVSVLPYSVRGLPERAICTVQKK